MRQNKEHPDVDEQNQEDVEEELADDLLTEVESSVYDDQHELGQQHRQEWHRNLDKDRYIHSHTDGQSITCTHIHTHLDRCIHM